MIIRKSNIKKVLLGIISIGCVVGSVCLYLVKDGQIEKLNSMKEIFLENEVQRNNPVDELLTQRMEMQLINAKDQIDELQLRMEFLQQEHDFLVLLERKANERETDDAREKLEKYFQIRQGELARIQGIESSEECGNWGFLNSHFGGITLAVDEDMYVQYYNSPPTPILEYLLPDSLIIMNPDIDLGFMGARVGMDFEEIQENAYEGEIHTGFMYNEDNEIYYIEYFDDYYEYIYASYKPDGSDSWMVINHL